MTVLRPKEILEADPTIASRFNETQIGQLLWLKLIRGRKTRRGCLVVMEDVQKIAQFHPGEEFQA